MSDTVFALLGRIYKEILAAKANGDFVCGLSVTLDDLRVIFDTISPGCVIDVNTVQLMGYPVLSTDYTSVVLAHHDFPEYRAIHDYFRVNGKLPKLVYTNRTSNGMGQAIGDIEIRNTTDLEPGRVVCV